jgi:hypothetical protein
MKLSVPVETKVRFLSKVFLMAAVLLWHKKNHPREISKIVDKLVPKLISRRIVPPPLQICH